MSRTIGQLFLGNGIIVKILISLNFIPHSFSALYSAEDWKATYVPTLRSLASNHSLPLSQEKKWHLKGFVKEINLNNCSYEIYEPLTKKC